MTSTAIAWRRDLHAHPEVGFTEFRTVSRVAGRLADLGWDVVAGAEVIDAGARLGVPPDDVVDTAYARAERAGGDDRFLPALRGGLTAAAATWHGSAPGPTVALRVDVDALPILEATDDHRPARDGFGSRYAGSMHACGHDGHVGMAIALAERLSADPPARGAVRLLIQPAEEGGRGAAAMVPAGVVDDVDVLFAAHLGIGLPSGTVAAAVDGLLANTKLRATFHGRAAHASMAPHEGRSALLGAAAATLAVHTMPPWPGHETRVAVGAVHGGTSSNIVPDRAEMLLETRADDGAVNAAITERVRAALEGAAATFGLTVDAEAIGSVTTAVADAAASDTVARAARDLGLAVVVPGADLGVASDDATAFMRRVQARGGTATYLAVGSDLPGAHHTPRFDVDEAVLGPGVDLLERVVRDALARGGPAGRRDDLG